ncbi:EAL domain-containing protein [Pseudoduganella violacea]|uniref:Diguanylate cyclase (GGDEF)-like protein n=1 Tax=Pseudoduganella violacea TaxID=1715466 RepID=A0A7W5BCX2_9BURK|nr:EAL domain-containing protein [Pseudoduganella violacea]MBB3120000.1 diguanylate cyclase (GGDEF)-like protein [Pseudoduganella violacea]
MFAFIDRLGLRLKLALGFGTVIVLMCLGDMTLMFGHERALAAVDHYFDSEDRMADLSSNSLMALERARRFKKDFLLEARVLPVGEAKTRYSALVGKELKVVRSSMAEIRRLKQGGAVEREVRAVEAALGLYEDSFQRLAAQYELLGNREQGQEAAFRGSGQELERMLMLLQAEAPRKAFLSMQSQEVAFAVHGEQASASTLLQRGEALQAVLAQTALAPAQKLAAQQLLERHLAAFRGYQNTLAEIGQASTAYNEAVRRIEPALLALRAQADQALQETRSSVRKANSSVSAIILVGGAASMLIGLYIARLLMRNIERSAAAGVRFARQLAAGDWSVRLPQGGTREFAELSVSLNAMADNLQQAYLREQGRTAELIGLNRTLRLRSRCNEAMVRVNDEAQLLDLICAHMVGEGGYPLVWVGMQNSAGAVAVAAQAGAAPGTELPGRRQVALALAGLRPAGDGAAESANCLVLPLKCRGELLGAICIVAPQAGAFDDAEIGLLRELVDDVAFGMYSLREEQRRQRAEQELAYQANHDALTGLANRNLFNDRLRQGAALAERMGRQLAVLAIGLERYRQVKDSLGHDAGNALLQHAAQQLSAELRDGDTLARLAGDEFVVVLGDLETGEQARAAAARLLRAVQAPFVWAGAAVASSASVGISLYPQDGMDAASLLCSANAAMASAQAMGGNRFRFYAPEMNERAMQLFTLESDLARAIEQGELCLHYQPRVNLESGAVRSAEALVRWRHPQRGMVPPGDFIALAENSGLIVPLGAWVIREVCRQQRAWIDAGLQTAVVAVNLSPRQFQDEHLVDEIRRALSDHGLDAACIEMEITESTVMDNAAEAGCKLNALKSLGISLSLDDFGTGHSSLSRLRHLPIDHLKIDQAFVRHLCSNAADAAICKAIVDLAHNLQLSVIAEGVEDAAQAAALRSWGCDDVQGFHFARPMPPEEFARMLAPEGQLAGLLPLAA